MRSINFKGRYLIILLIGCLLSVSDAYSQKVASTSMQFLKVLPSARAAALGEAYSVWATGAEAIFWNPGGIATVENMELSSTYIDWLFDTQQGALSYALAVRGFGVVGVQIQYVDFGEFEETSNQRPYINDPDRIGLTGNTFRPFSYLVGITYGRYLTERFSLGLGFKFAHESLFNGRTVRTMVRQDVFDEVDTWANAFLFDFGIRYNTGYRSIHIASAVQNFGADVTYARDATPVPLMFRFGIGADLIGSDGLFAGGREDNRISAAFDIFHPNDYAQQIHMGVEYEYAGTFALRGGYKLNYDFDGLTLGAGIKHTIDRVALSVDYSYGAMGTYLGNVQRLSLGVIIP